MPLSAFLIEDEPTIRDNLIALMHEVVHARVVGTAETEAEAIAWLDSHGGNWNLAVVDLFLKEGTGFAVLASLRRNPATARVVVLTNTATPENRQRCLDLGADAVFDKTHELEAFFEYCARTESGFGALG